MLPNFGEISSNNYEDIVYIVFTLFCVLFPAVTLTFDLSTPKANQHIYEPKYICDQNWVKFPSLVFEIWYSQSLRDAQTHPLTHSLTDGQTRMHCASGTVFQRWHRHRKTIIQDSVT